MGKRPGKFTRFYCRLHVPGALPCVRVHFSYHNPSLVFCSTPSFPGPHLVITHQATLAGESSWLQSPSPVRLALQGLYTSDVDVGFSPSMALSYPSLLNPPKAAMCIREPHGDSGATVPAPAYDSHHHCQTLASRFLTTTLQHSSELFFQEHKMLPANPKLKVEESPIVFLNQASCFPEPWTCGNFLKSSTGLEHIRT